MDFPRSRRGPLDLPMNLLEAHNDPTADVHAPGLEDLASVLPDVVFRGVLFGIGLAVVQLSLHRGLGESVACARRLRALF